MDIQRGREGGSDLEWGPQKEAETCLASPLATAETCLASPRVTFLARRSRGGTGSIWEAALTARGADKAHKPHTPHTPLLLVLLVRVALHLHLLLLLLLPMRQAVPKHRNTGL